MNKESLYEVAIGLLPGIGSQNTRLLVSYCGSAEGVFKETKGKLRKIPGIGDILANNIINQNVLKDAEEEMCKAEAEDIRILFYTNKSYPHRLKQIPDAPTLLYYKGKADLNAAKVISVVGTRKATEYGKEATAKIIAGLKKHDALIVSGLAYGIDIAAHKSALEYEMLTIGVMASGIDIIYPSSHKSIAAKMCESGGLLTEYRFGSKPDGPRFPARNRIIAGLCDALIVVEAANKGGALISAEIANEYDREVFAVPGNLNQKYSEGCNRLIQRHKANIFTNLSDLEYILNWDLENNFPGHIVRNNLVDYSQFSTEEIQVIKILENEPILIDDLSWKTQIPVNRLASILLQLEFRGNVKSLPGKKYKMA